MVIDISIKALALLFIQTVGFIGGVTLIGFFMYYTDDPSTKPDKFKNTVFSILVVIAFVLIYGIVQINWLP